MRTSGRTRPQAPRRSSYPCTPKAAEVYLRRRPMTTRGAAKAVEPDSTRQPGGLHGGGRTGRWSCTPRGVPRAALRPRAEVAVDRTAPTLVSLGRRRHADIAPVVRGERPRCLRRCAGEAVGPQPRRPSYVLAAIQVSNRPLYPIIYAGRASPQS